MNRRMRSQTMGAGFVLLLMTAGVWPAMAYPRLYRVTVDGARKPGSEVCFYAVEPAGAALARFTATTRARCVSATEMLDLPEGSFRVFARHPDGYVSERTHALVNRAGPVPRKQQQGPEELPMRRAAIADFENVLRTLQADVTAGVWLMPEGTSDGAFLPLVAGESAVMIPEHRAVVPLLLRDGVPVAVGEPIHLDAGEREMVRFAPHRDRRGDVVAWVRGYRPGHEEGAAEPEQSAVFSAPEVVARAGEVSFEPLVPTTSLPPAASSLIFFRDLPAGPIHLAATGKLWLPSEKVVQVEPGLVTAVHDPLPLVPAAALSVTWELDACPAGDEPCQKGDPCGAAPKLLVTLERCDGAPPGGAAECTAERRVHAAFGPDGRAEFAGLRPGDYRVRVAAPFSTPQSYRVLLRAGRETTTPIALQKFQFFGTVKLDGEPLQARLLFATGAAVSDAAGHYTAVLPASPLANAVDVIPCDGSAPLSFVPGASPLENGPLDIDLRTRRLRVRVVEHRGGPVADAEVHFGQASPGEVDGAEYWSEKQVTDREGRAVFARAPADQTLMLCARHPAYARACTPPLGRDFMVSGKEVVLQFEEVLGRGRIVGHAGHGVLAWVDRQGRITEEVRPEAGGEFLVRRTHARDEYLVYTSSKKPLAVLSQPETVPGAEIVITLPPAPAHSFSVIVPPSPMERLVGLWVGGRYVPMALLLLHHDQRGINIVPERDLPLQFTDIAASAPLAVAYVAYLPPPGPFVDPFTRPEYANAPRYLVTGREVVIPTAPSVASKPTA